MSAMPESANAVSSRAVRSIHRETFLSQEGSVTWRSVNQRLDKHFHYDVNTKVENQNNTPRNENHAAQIKGDRASCCDLIRYIEARRDTRARRDTHKSGTRRRNKTASDDRSPFHQKHASCIMGSKRGKNDHFENVCVLFMNAKTTAPEARSCIAPAAAHGSKTSQDKTARPWQAIAALHGSGHFYFHNPPASAAAAASASASAASAA